MNAYQNYYVEWKKPDTKEYMLFFFPFIYISEKYKPNYHEWKETSFSLGLEVGYRYAAKEQD